MKVQIVSPPMFPQSYLTNFQTVEFAFAKQKTTYSIFLGAKITTYSVFGRVNFTTYSVFGENKYYSNYYNTDD